MSGANGSGRRVSEQDRSDRMVGWYLLAVFLAGGSVFTAVSAEVSLWLSAGLGLVTAGVAFVAVARTAPQERDGSSIQTVVAVIGAVVGLAVVRALDSGLALHLLVSVALGILVGALWRRGRGG